MKNLITHDAFGRPINQEAINRAELFIARERAVRQTAEIAKALILEDVENGTIPHLTEIASFVELHDYVDANEYLICCDFIDNLNQSLELDIECYNKVSDILNDFIDQYLLFEGSEEDEYEEHVCENETCRKFYYGNHNGGECQSCSK